MGTGLPPPMLDRSARIDEAEFMFQHNWGYENENCQVLNIWTPSISPGKKRPVMVWIHGGGFTFGSSQDLPLYDGERLSKKGDIVMVSVNHRLNVLGFADLSGFGEEFKFSANAGMMDLVAALSWIRDNIDNFGGDPDNVTIFGQSGGGAKVATLMYAPDARGLFHKAVVQSGGDPKFQDPAVTRRIGRALVKELGITKEKIHTIQTIPHDRLIRAADKALAEVRTALIKEGNPPLGYGFGFSPCLDGTVLPFAPRDPKALALSREVPLLIGSNKNEVPASVWHHPPLKDTGAEAVSAFIRNKYRDKAEAFTAAVKSAYPNDRDATDLIDVDTVFRRATVNQADYKSRNGGAPVFMYLFSWTAPVFNGRYKALHSLELPFVFDNIGLAGEMTGGGACAHALAHKISTAWISFARTGNPGHDGLPLWPAYTPENGNTMLLDKVCSVVKNHDRDLLSITAGEPPLW